jgi:hypothetical protein
MGTAEWPRALDASEAQAMRSAGIPVIPENVSIVALEPDREAENKSQLVVRFNDARGVIIVDGYTNPTQKPLFTQEWPLPKVTPAPGVQELFESQVETGASYQAF